MFVEDVVVYIPSCMMMYIYLPTLLVQIISVFCFGAADVLWVEGASQFPVHGDRDVKCYRVSRPHSRITAARYPVAISGSLAAFVNPSHTGKQFTLSRRKARIVQDVRPE
jgi:hypothetical protein